MKRDVLAGMLLTNAIPHAVMGIAGKRCLTPLGGEDSSPGLNLIWSALNLAGGAAVLASGSWADASQRRVTTHTGMFVMATFGVCYELTVGRRKRALTG